MTDLLVLFSGGADSVLLLEFAAQMGREPFALMIDYGQLHKAELAKGKKFLERAGIPHTTVEIKGLTAQSALTGTGMRGQYKGVSEWHVPGRNTMFLAIALSEAEGRGIKEIWYGPDYSDRENLFPDCYQEYVYAFNKVAEIQGSCPIKVLAPTLGLTKPMVLALLKERGITKGTIYSGYGGLENDGRRSAAQPGGKK
jgi:7-cyano-7-deazaguanine synthase